MHLHWGRGGVLKGATRAWLGAGAQGLTGSLAKLGYSPPKLGCSLAKLGYSLAKLGYILLWLGREA